MVLGGSAMSLKDSGQKRPWKAMLWMQNATLAFLNWPRGWYTSCE